MIDIDNIAKLARIGLSDPEKEKLSKEVEAILDFIAKLNEVNVENIEPVSHAVGLKNVFRADSAASQPENCQEKLLLNAPDRDDNFVKVKTILEK